MKTTIIGAKFRVSTLELNVKNYDFIVPHKEHTLREKQKPIVGKQRPTIIAEILSDYRLYNEDFYKVDSHEFKLKFMDAHTPIEEVILPVL